MRSISLFGLAAVAIITSLPADACRCLVYDTEEMARTAFQEADLVFMGTAVSTSPALVPDERGEALSSTQFSLNRVFVGNGDGAVDIIHRGMRDGNLCGPYFDDGSSYLVLAYEEDGLLVTTGCDSYPEDYVTDAMQTALESLPDNLGPSIAHGETLTSDETRLCDMSNSRIETDYQIDELSLRPEYAPAAFNALRISIPDTVERTQARGGEASLNHGETGMVYHNNLNFLEGLTLRQNALLEQAEGTSGPATEALCEFLNTTSIMD